MAQRAYSSTGNRLIWVAVLLFAVIAAGFAIYAYKRHVTVTGQIYRICADHAPPYYFLRPDGRIEGLAVDILSEAARRRKIRLQWVRIEKMVPDDAFRNDLVDIWPAIAAT